jgi:Porin subfamily
MEVEMKMVKSLLLGTAAGLVSVVGAQAADMPVKAAPVQYVKICSLYGDAFYYIPGTDTCIKFGGFIRVQAEYNAGAGGIPVGSGSGEGAQARYARDVTNDVNYRTRSALSVDVRQQTQYGVLRTYFRIGVQVTTPADNEAAGSVFWDRAFIQFAGFTVGKAQSFFDIAGGLGDINYHNTRVQGDTGAAGVTVWAYTAQFGNGFSGTVSAESPVGHNRFPVVDVNAPGFFAANAAAPGDTAFAIQTAANNGFRVPDIIGNLRVDQAWGYVGVSAAVHEASGAYYSPVAAVAAANGVDAVALGANLVNNGHPADRYGWAFAIGGRLNLAGGDLLGANACYTEGAVGYCTNITTGIQAYNASTSVGIGWLGDGVFGNGTQVELTRVWSAVAYYQHIWNPNWRTSLYGGYVNISYDQNAKNLINGSFGGTAAGFISVAQGAAARALCAPGVTSPPAGAPGFTQLAPALGNSCSPDFSFYELGTRTQWNPVPQLDIGLDLLYTRFNTAYKGPGIYATNLPRPTVFLMDDQSVWSAFFRWQRNFYP